MMYHSSVGVGLLAYTLASRQKGKTMILKYTQMLVIRMYNVAVTFLF
jgi:hypothetical protein